VSGGDIRKAVLKPPLRPLLNRVPGRRNRVHQRHRETGIDEVIAARRVMRQSLLAFENVVLPESNLAASATPHQTTPHYGLR